jgi:hypothetical protein
LEIEVGLLDVRGEPRAGNVQETFQKFLYSLRRSENCPFALIVRTGPEFTWRIDVTSSGACGAHACQAAIASSAEPHGHSTLK